MVDGSQTTGVSDGVPGPDSRIRAIRSLPGSADGLPESAAFDPFGRELSATRKKVAELVADRALLLARISILEHDLKKTERFACHDALTGLPNRRLLEERYALAIARSARRGDDVALLFIDIDDFKKVNDTFGHGVADNILQRFAARLASSIRVSDTACRYGGDEFVVLLSDCRGAYEAAATAANIRQRLSTPFAVDNLRLELAVSIGVALYSADGPELGRLMVAADANMYRSKGEVSGDLGAQSDCAAGSDTCSSGSARQ